ncbi:TPA: PorV/PorQ family protein [Candidatus Poribacteria bacterium]|nr:PorV/PorQ family protein [Candidatus Poribacteria bacterium]
MVGKKQLLQLAIVSLILTFLFAQFSFAGVNAAPHLNTGAGARSLGMAGAFTAVANDATSTVWNPAGLSVAKDLTFTLATERLDFDRKHNFMAAVKKLGEKSALGFSVVSFGVDGIEERLTKDDISAKSTFNYSMHAFALSYGRSLGSINLGTSLRILTDQFGVGTDEKVNGFGGVSIGLLGHLYSNTVSYGVVLKNLFGSINESSLPAVLDLGVAFSLLQRNMVTFAVDLEREFVDIEESTTSARIGIEYLIGNTFSIRGGTKATSDRLSLYGGFGVNVAGLQVDYAIKLADSAEHKLNDSGNIHLVSLSYSY